MRVILSCVAFLLVPFGMVSAQVYLIQPGDRLEVSVLEDPGLNRTVLVRPDGRISLPLAGTITAANRTPEDVQGAIRSALAPDFVQPPNVTVSLVSVGQSDAAVMEDEENLAVIYVIGEVNQPGALTVTLPLDVLQALALAGGPATFAARDRIQVRRRTPGAGETLHIFSYENIEDGLVPSTEISLQDGDVIVVPERGLFE